MVFILLIVVFVSSVQSALCNCIAKIIWYYCLINSVPVYSVVTAFLYLTEFEKRGHFALNFTINTILS